MSSICSSYQSYTWSLVSSIKADRVRCLIISDQGILLFRCAQYLGFSSFVLPLIDIRQSKYMYPGSSKSDYCITFPPQWVELGTFIGHRWVGSTILILRHKIIDMGGGRMIFLYSSIQRMFQRNTNLRHVVRNFRENNVYSPLFGETLRLVACDHCKQALCSSLLTIVPSHHPPIAKKASK
jgi:hypothetical protein